MTSPHSCPACGKALDPRIGICKPCLFASALAEADAVTADFGDIIPPRIRYIGEYEVLQQIARGGMGVVFRARQTNLNRVVALKLLTGSACASEEMIRRFKAEAEIAAALRHPNIVAIYDIGEHEGEPYFAMEFIDGFPLRSLAEARISLRLGVEILAKVAAVVQFAHQHGVIHRDLKPGNILVDRDSQPHLTDFGIAKLVEFDSSLTHTNALLGTPSYVAPEVAAGKTKFASTAVDVYGLGAVLYFLVTGTAPFAGGTSMATIRQVIDEAPHKPSIFNPEVDSDLETVILKCLEKDPASRYASAGEVAEELSRWLGGKPIQARPAGIFGRTEKWIRRHPVYALLLLLLASSFGFGAGGIVWQWRRAETLRLIAEDHRRTAENSRAIADAQRDLARNQAYAADISMAQLVLKEGEVDRAVALLNAQVPKKGQTDLRGIDWRFLWGQIHAIPEHSWRLDGAGILEMKPAGPTLAAFLEEEGARCMIRNLTNGAAVAAFAPSEPYTTMDYFAPADLLAGGTAAGTLQLAEFSSGRVRWSIRRPGPIEDIALSRDGKWLAASHRSQTGPRPTLHTELFDLQTGERLKEVPMKGGADIQFSMRNEFLYMREEGAIHVYSLPDCVEVPFNHISSPTIRFCSALASNGLEVAFSSMHDDEIFNFPLGENTSIKNRRIWAHKGPVLALAPGPAGTFLSFGADHMLKLWDVATGRELRRVPIPAHDGSVLLCLTDNTVSVGRGNVVTTALLSAVQHAHIDPQRQWLQGKPVVAPNARLAAFTIRGGRTDVVSLRTGQTVASTTGAMRSIAFNHSSTKLYLLEQHDLEGVRLVHWKFEENSQQRVPLRGASLEPFAMEPNEAWLAGQTADRELALWSTTDGTLRMPTPKAWSKPVAFTPNNEFLLAVDQKETQIEFWSMNSFRVEKTLPFDSPVVSAAFSPDADRVAVGCKNGEVFVYTFPTLVPLVQLSSGPTSFASLQFGPDWNILGTETSWLGPRVWDLRTGRELLAFNEVHLQALWLPDSVLFLRPFSAPLTSIHRLSSFSEIEAAQVESSPAFTPAK